MKRTRLSLLALVAVAACAIVHTMHVARADVVASADYAWRRLVHGIAEFGSYLARAMRHPLVQVLRGPVVALVVARTYVLRQIKRERPRLAAQWRMCPTI